MQGYQAIDELNRAFHKMPSSGFVQTPYLVTPENISAEGGDRNTFIPSNNYEKHYLELWGVKSREIACRENGKKECSAWGGGLSQQMARRVRRTRAP